MGSGAVYGGASTTRKPGDNDGDVFMDLTDFKNNYSFLDFGMVFLHEFNHGYFGLIDDFTNPDPTSTDGMLRYYGYRGQTVLKVNKYEQQLNYPIRMSYPSIDGKGALFQQTTQTKSKNGKIKIRTTIFNANF